MDPERWLRVKELFHAATDQESDGRESFLAEACAGDAELRREVEAMLASDADDDSSFLESPISPAVGEAGADLPDEGLGPTIGERVGDWRITREIASGGMGTVYLAVRADKQYEQTAAVKVVGEGLESEAILQRFRDERQTLARLSHPHIARLLDGGVTAAGRPYLVMEYVDGLRIDRHCDEHGLAVEERLRLFRDVCAAVHYAHQNLVVHRDLKPGNVLVDRAGVPKLLDFGIAKVLGGEDRESTSGAGAATLTGARLMTPWYASPEQVRGEPVTTVSDVYSLGVVLYELLTGRGPYRLRTRLPHEVERAVCEDEPERPSTVAGFPDESRTDGATGSSLRAGDLDPARLRRRLRGDLDTIVLTAIQKEPARRYASAEQLSEDIRRYLAGLPILARPDTWTYRTGKLLRRNKLATAMGALLAIVLVTGVAAVGWSARVALRERDAALAAGRRADREAAAARDEARRTRRVSRFLRNLMSEAGPTRRGHDALVRDVLDQSAQTIGYELEGDPEVEAEVRTTMGATYASLGLFEEADQHLTVALDLYRSVFGDEHELVARSLGRLGALRLTQGRFDEAEALLGGALDMLRRGGPDDGDAGDVLRNLGVLHKERGDVVTAKALMLEAIAIERRVHGEDSLSVAAMLNTLAVALESAKRELPEAERLLREAIAIAEQRLPSDHLTLAIYLHNLGFVLWDLGRVAESRVATERAYQIRRRRLPADHPSLAASLLGMGRILLTEGRPPDEIEPLLREALAVLRKAHGDDHPDLAPCHANLGRILRAKGDLDGAEEHYLRAVEILESHHGPAHPDLAEALTGLAMLHAQRGDRSTAEDLVERALDICLETFGREHRSTARALSDLARYRLDRGDLEGAIELYAEALEVYRVVLPRTHTRLADALWSVAYAEVKSGELEPATVHLAEMIELCEENPEDQSRRIGLAAGLLGECLTRLDRFDEAETQLTRSHDLFAATLGERHDATLGALRRLAALHEARGEPERAAAVRERIEAAGPER